VIIGLLNIKLTKSALKRYFILFFIFEHVFDLFFSFLFFFSTFFPWLSSSPPPKKMVVEKIAKYKLTLLHYLTTDNLIITKAVLT